MNKTKIEWCDSTWNPVTGCKHGCEYCYARRIAERFGGGWETASGRFPVLDAPARGVRSGKRHSRVEQYPYSFTPTFHRYRLDEPQRTKKPQTIFVCSMSDLFGSWVPDSWIEEVFTACEKAPQHRYLFLTKNPARYHKLALLGKLPQADNYWYGSTITNPDDYFWHSGSHNTFISAEPILGDFSAEKLLHFDYANWIILGAMTGPGSKEHTPERETIDNIVEAVGSPIFMKDSLLTIMGKMHMRRELPWERET